VIEKSLNFQLGTPITNLPHPPYGSCLLPEDFLIFPFVTAVFNKSLSSISAKQRRAKFSFCKHFYPAFGESNDRLAEWITRDGEHF
jgi:hypothetical protein